MKVSTDACIQGAWTPVEGAAKILDIGAGTGLLSLMLAQRQPGAQVTALERDEDAAMQARENVSASAFSNRIEIIQSDALHWKTASEHRFDLIISNPPFFQNSLKGPDTARNAARHNDTLTPKSLAAIIVSNLSENGSASLMWPPDSYELFKAEAAESGLFESRVLIVRDRPGSRITRMIGIFERKSELQNSVQEELFVKNESGAYSEKFKTLLAPFYLKL